MRDPKEYTADSICRAMQLDRFVVLDWMSAARPAVRVLLTPSFHPEICVTFVGGDESAALAVSALHEQYWASHGSTVFRKDEEQTLVTDAVLSATIELFKASITAATVGRRTAFVDGMGAKSCYVIGGKVEEIDSHVTRHSKYGEFVANVIRLAWTNCRNPFVRNALARTAEYLEERLPIDPEPARKRPTHVTVLGTEDERSSYFEALRKKTAN